MRYLLGCLLCCLLLNTACGGGGGTPPQPVSTIATPTQFKVVQGSYANEIILSWVAPLGAIDGYELEAKKDEDAFQKIHTGLIPSDYTNIQLAFSDAAPEMTTFAFRLRAAKGESFSAYTNEASHQLGLKAPLSVIGQMDWAQNGISLAWTRNSEVADGVLVERSESDAWGSLIGTWSPLPMADPKGSSLLDLTVVSRHYYVYRVTNTKGAITSVPSWASGPVFVGLSAPSWIYASWDGGKSGVQVTWTTNTSASDSAKLERIESDSSGALIGSWAVIANLPAATTTYLDGNVEEAKYYCYRVTNLRGAIESDASQSSYRIFMPLFAPIKLLVENTPTGFRLTWENRSKMANEVVVRRCLGSNGWSSSSSDVALLAPDATVYEDAGMSLGYYTYFVVAKQGYQESSSLGVSGVTVNPAGSMNLNGYMLGLPNGSDASLRPTGTWAFATQSPFGIRANTGDTWPAYFPANVSNAPSPCLKVDAKGWPHFVFTRNNPQNTKEYVVTHDWYDGVAWKSEEVAKCKLYLSSAQDGIDFCLDGSGEPHILLDRLADGSSWGGSTDNLTYFHKVDGTWVSESLANVQPKVTNIGTFHIFLDGLNNPHILLGNWSTVVECTKDTLGAWSGQVLPTGNVFAGWYDYLEGLWADPDHGWVFYERYGSSTAGMSYALVALEKKNGVWLEPVVLGGRAHDGSSTTANAALSGDYTRVAVTYRSTHGLQVFHQDQAGWHQTLAGPDPGGYQLLRIGFDGNNLLHLIHHFGDGFKEYREQAPASLKLSKNR